MSAESAWIISTTDATFELDVIERSRTVPVVVDFWASWCQPCKLLRPVLEKLAQEYGGKFVLVAAETEQNQAAAREFNVSSIPAVFALVNGEVVDMFGGVVPEEQLRGWLDRVIAEFEIASLSQLETADPAAAETKVRELLAAQPREDRLKIALARVLLAQDRIADAREVISALEARGFLEPEAETIKAALELAGMKGGDVAALAQAAATAPDDLTKQCDYAQALAGAGRHEEALAACLKIVTAQKDGPGEVARQLMVDIFRVLPGDSELTQTYRRKLASALY
jgi:putative thioredoxin